MQRYSSYRVQRTAKPHPARRWWVTLLVLAMSGLVTFAMLHFMHNGSNAGVTNTQGADVAQETPPPPPPEPSIVLTPNTEIEQIIADNAAYDIGVGLQDISTGEHKAYGVTDRFTAASTGKLLTAAAYYHAVEVGEQSLDTMIGSRTAEAQIQQMINQSNNDSWELLELHLGIQAITDYAASIHCDYITNGNTVTPASMASFLSELYSGKLLNKEHTQQLLSYMQNTNWETLIPAALPEGITVYHKYGLLTWVIHDVAILVKDDKAYALTVYTAGADYTSNDARAAIIRAVTQAAVKQLFGESSLAGS